MTKRRLIESWLPIAAIGEESLRERRSMSALPPTYYLHVWWARRPLVASRAAILASLLPEDADREKFMHVLGIHGDPVEAKARIEEARRTGVRFEGEAYPYKRAFTYSPNGADIEWADSLIERMHGRKAVVLDPTAGGGSIPFEACRLGLQTFSNDINPVASLIQHATVLWPSVYGENIHKAFKAVSELYIERRDNILGKYFPKMKDENCVTTNFLWARTVSCPYCLGVIPLSPNWKLSKKNQGVRLIPHHQNGPGSVGRHCSFEIVDSASDHSFGTVNRGAALCPYSDCGRIVDSKEIARIAVNGGMGEQLYAVVYKRAVSSLSKTKRVKWKREFRAPTEDDTDMTAVHESLVAGTLDWQAQNYMPTEEIPLGMNTKEPLRFGMRTWCELFNPRQLLGHITAVQVYREMVDEFESLGRMTSLQRSAFAYLALSLDKMLNYNSRLSVWLPNREVVANTFNRHDLSISWSYAEMPPLVAGLEYDWAIKQTAKSVKELVDLLKVDSSRQVSAKNGKSDPQQYSALLDNNPPETPISKPPVVITAGSADSMHHIDNETIDVVVMDPPYYDNVMYAELSDFFYVWLKRTAGVLYPHLFTRALTDKDNEAVANVAKYRGVSGARAKAEADYRERMQSIFLECRRVLRPDGIMTLMFTHKATGAWDALTTGLMEAGFIVSASWPINTEAEGSLHIRNKSAAKSTIFLSCRPRPKSDESVQHYWEDVEPMVVRAVRTRMEEFSSAGISGVDLYLASFGPALEEFSKHWPLKRGTPAPLPTKRKGRMTPVTPDQFDPYAVSPEDALNAARREVKQWRLDKLATKRGNNDLDPVTTFFVLAWDAFRAPEFPFDEALHLARAVGADIDRDIIGKIADKSGSNVRLWDSSLRAAKQSLGGEDGSRYMLDAIHHAAHVARTSVDAAVELLEESGAARSPLFLQALEAVLEVLPVGQSFGGAKLAGDLSAASSDFDALEKLRRIAFSDQVDKPSQVDLWSDSTV